VALLEEVENNWDLPNWLSNITQCVSQYGHALANTQPLSKPSSKGRRHQHGGTTYIDMQKVGCALTQDVRGTRQSLPTGFTRRDPAPASHLTLIMLAEHLRDLSRPVNRADLDEVVSDLRLILASEGDLVTKNSLSRSRFFGKQQVGRGKFSPITAFDEAFGEWEARTGDCRPPVLVPPGRGLTEDATAAQDITAMALQGALLVRSALPEEINSMAAGGDVKETVMTIPFIRTCIINMIVDLEKNFTLDAIKRRALVQPEAPWKWFTSYELGLTPVSDEHDRPMHPLVETFVDDQLEAQ